MPISAGATNLCTGHLQARGTLGANVFRSLGGVNIRLQQTPHDGHGDVMNSIALARAFRERHPGLPVSIMIDERITYTQICERFPAFDCKSGVNLLDGIEVIHSGSEIGKTKEGLKKIEIIRVPAFGDEFPFQMGQAKYNIFLEEPGAPRSDFNYLGLSRGEIFRNTDGRLHTRVNPGFGETAYGVYLPEIPLQSSTSTRAQVLKSIEERYQISLPEDAVHAPWTMAYHHQAERKANARYYSALLKTLKERPTKDPVYIFAFNRYKEEGERPEFYKKFHLEPLAHHVNALYGFNHILPGGQVVEGSIERGKKSPYTIVYLKDSKHDLFLDVMRNADLPVLVTGTQSLFEALSLGKPFYYETLIWKKDLAWGMANHAIKNFPLREAQILLDLLIGDDMSLYMDTTRAHIKALHAGGQMWRPRIKEARRKVALSVLMKSPEQQALMAELMRSLRKEANMVDRLEEVVLKMMDKDRLSSNAKNPVNMEDFFEKR